MRHRNRRNPEDFAAEIASHLEMEADDLRADGIAELEAKRRARAAFGSASVARERFRLRNRVHWLDNVARDVHFALRQLHRAPGFTLTAILTLALGLGANMSVFSLINGLLLRPLPVPHAEQLTIVASRTTQDAEGNDHFSASMFRALEKHHEVFQDVAAYWSPMMQVRGNAGNVEMKGAMVSGEFFREMQTAPALGRFLTPQDDRAGNPSGYPAVISNSFWHKWFNASPSVVGSRLIIANTPFTVVGVMPKDFIGADPSKRPEIYVPLSAEPVIDAPFNMTAEGERAIWLQILVRRNPGTTIDQANVALKSISDPILRESVLHGNSLKNQLKQHFQLTAEPGSKGDSYLRERFKEPLLVVFALCGAMLLLACINLASLLMARATARERELATRLAIGASRRRLVQQLLIESLLVSLVGAAVGLALAPVVSRLLSALLLSQDPLGVLDTSLDLRVFAFAGSLALFAGVLTGLVPALRATSGDLNEHIKNGAHATPTGKSLRGLIPNMLMGSEIALALILVIGAGLLSISLSRLYRAGLGFESKNLVSIELEMSKQALEGDALLHWYQNLAGALSKQPGVKGVSFESVPPLSGMMMLTTLKTATTASGVNVSMNQVAPEYFETMRIPLLEGREFTWQDTLASGRKVILNKAAAIALFPGQDPLGKLVTDEGDKFQNEVIAVVGDVTYDSIRKPAPATMYRSVTQDDSSSKNSYSAVVRIAGSEAPLAAAARNLTTRINPDIPAPVLSSMSQILDASITSERMMAMLSVFFAGCALMVTGIGLYGTLAYATAKRTKEIGIRMALGSQRMQVVLLILMENTWAAISGSAAGLIVALFASRALSSFLYGTSVHDPWILIGSVALLILIASAASILPAIRAASIEPVQALRTE